MKADCIPNVFRFSKYRSESLRRQFKVFQKLYCLQYIGLIICLIFGGCVSTKQPEVKAIVHGNILLLPPQAGKSDTIVFDCSLGDFVFLELSQRFPNAVVDARSYSTFRDSESWVGAYRDGQLDFAELAAMARVARCDTVLVLTVIGVQHYAPQRLDLSLDWYSLDTNRQRNIQVHCNLEEAGWRRMYREYNSKASGKDDWWATARLSPRQFHRFAAHLLGNAVERLIAEENADLAFTENP